MSCLITGDSIAVGLSWFIKGCVVAAKVGAPSAYILEHTPMISVDTAYISAGSNDPYNPDLAKNLIAIRTKIDAKKFVFILPTNLQARDNLYIIAMKNGDGVVQFTAGKDGIHPKSYKDLANAAREK